MTIVPSTTPAWLACRRSHLSAQILVSKMRSPSVSAERRRPAVLGLAVASAMFAFGMGVFLSSGSTLVKVTCGALALAVLFFATRLQRGRLGRNAPRIGVAATALILGLALSVVDAEAVSKSLAYVIILLVIAFRFFGERSRGARDNIWADLPLVLLLAWGTVGTLLGRILYGQGENALPFFVAMLLSLIHIYRPLELNEEKSRRLSNLLVAVSTLYVAIAVFANLEQVSWMVDFMHTRSYFLILALSGAALLRRWWLFGVLIAGTLFVFFEYPALTYVIVFVGAIIVVLVMRVRRSAVVVIAAVGIAATLIIMSAGSNGVDLTSTSAKYFAQVGKSDNTRARDELILLGEQRISQSPVLGSGFIDDLSVTPPPGFVNPDTVVPVHNDYIQFAIGGGLIGGGLLACFLGLLVARGIRVARACRTQGRQASSQLAAMLTATILAMGLIAYFNPILIDLQNAFCLAIFYDILASIQISPRLRDSSDLAGSSDLTVTTRVEGADVGRP
jgi:O-Antigen ligase